MARSGEKLGQIRDRTKLVAQREGFVCSFNVLVCKYVHVHMGALKSQKKASDLLELEL